MYTLPFLPNPYPDEILGSWLLRIALHNGRGAWKNYLEETGNRDITGSLFDMFKIETRSCALIKALGYSIDDIVMKHTTLPYWLAFGIPETKKSEELKQQCGSTCSNVSHTILDKIARPGFHRRLGVARTARACSACLDEDLRTFGETYWHRSHQLPNLSMCHKHGNLLQSACPSCGLGFAPIGLKRLQLPKIRCTCGELLKSPNQVEHGLNPIFIKITNFSVAALNSVPASWSADGSRAYMKEWMSESFQLRYGTFLNFLAASYGLSLTQGNNLIHSTDSGGWMYLRGALRFSRAPECCAFFAALDVDFKTVQKDLKARGSEFIENQHSLALRHDRTIPWNVNSAREHLIQFKKNYPKRSVHRCCLAYWYLRLYDVVWLKKIFKIRNSKCPAVKTDRKSITAQLRRNAHLSPAQCRQEIRSTIPGVRCQFRDFDWLQKKLQILKKSRLDSKMINSVKTRACRDEILKQRSLLLQSALNQVLNSDARPVQVTYTLLAKIVGISTRQAQTVFEAFPELGQEMRLAKASIVKRKIEYAIRVLLEQNLPMYITHVLQEAKISDKNQRASIASELPHLIKQSQDRMILR